MTAAERIAQQIGVCTLCAGQVAATATGHVLRPFVRFRPTARVLIAGRTPGARAQAAGRRVRCAGGPRLCRPLQQAARAAGERR